MNLNKKEEVQKKLEEYRTKKERLLKFIQHIHNKYENNLLSQEERKLILERSLKGKSPRELLDSYDNSINQLTEELYELQTNSSTSKNKNIALGIIAFAVLSIFLFSLLHLKITGLAFGIPEENGNATIQPVDQSTENPVTPTKNETVPTEQNSQDKLKIPEEKEDKKINETIVNVTSPTISQDFSTQADQPFDHQFEQNRAENANLPAGFFIQGSGNQEEDDGCIDSKSWILTNDGYHGKGIIYIPELDNMACGIKLPKFRYSAKDVKKGFQLVFKSNFTNPESYMELLNYGYYNLCDVGFNNNGLTKQVGCHAEITDLGNGWKKLIVTNWEIRENSQPVDLFITPSSLLYQQFGETGTIILDEFSIEK